ncbi:Isoprenylcysteine carboxyl methyltransferase [Mycolicibacterium rhodesiae JS60]|nr:Isoprenylcysteine carboxyl methyltransferase [Mycolicibacterium rhodesiae JS60]
MSLLLRIVISSMLGIVAFAVLLFVPAGTLDYWQGWTLLAVFAVMSLAPTMFLNRVDPAAIERRTHAGVKAETRPTQKVVIAGTFLVFGAMLVVPALDYRFGWSHVPGWLSVVGDVMVAAGLGLAMLVVFQNRYASANITVEEGQPLVSTGLYGIVRHPMYFGNTILMIGIVLALGSYWSLLLVPIGLLLMVARILDEEKLLNAELDGYRQYTRKVRYRLVPLIW